MCVSIWKTHVDSPTNLSSDRVFMLVNGCGVNMAHFALFRGSHLWI